MIWANRATRRPLSPTGRFFSAPTGTSTASRRIKRFEKNMIEHEPRETDRTEAERLLAQFGTIQEANRAGRLTEEFYLALTQQQQIRRIVLKAAVEEWLTECKGATATGTLRRYREIAKAFLSFLKADD